MTQALAILTLSVVLAQATPEGRFVTQTGELTADPLAAIGVTTCAGVEGERVPVAALGTAMAEASDVFADGAKLALEADGRVYAANPDDPVAAVALQAATAEGQLIEVLIK